MEIFRMTAIVLEVLTEVEDKIVDGPGCGINVVSPNGLKDLLPGNHFIPVFDEQLQEHSFLLTQLDTLAVFCNSLLGFEVDAVFSEGILFAGGILVLYLFTFFDQLLDAEQELFEIEWFGQVVV